MHQTFMVVHKQLLIPNNHVFYTLYPSKVKFIYMYIYIYMNMGVESTLARSAKCRGSRAKYT